MSAVRRRLQSSKGGTYQYCEQPDCEFDEKYIPPSQDPRTLAWVLGDWNDGDGNGGHDCNQVCKRYNTEYTCDDQRLKNINFYEDIDHIDIVTDTNLNTNTLKEYKNIYTNPSYTEWSKIDTMPHLVERDGQLKWEIPEQAWARASCSAQTDTRRRATRSRSRWALSPPPPSHMPDPVQ